MSVPRSSDNPSSDNPFEERLWGRFSGVLRWEQLEALWERVLAEPEGWYLYEVGEAVPEDTVDPHGLGGLLHDVDRVLREKHRHDYCGIVYVDDPALPGLIKIYDPGNLGVVCGPGNERVLPRWILSRERPQPLRGDNAVEGAGNGAPGDDRVWWRRFFS